jgi:secretion/DNA translocation related TadE-like protein
MSVGVVVGGIVLALAVLIGSLVMSHVAASRQSRSAADLAALAAAGEAIQSPSDTQACAVAGAVASQNSGRAVSCDIVRAGDEVAVKVEVEVEVGWTMPGLPSTVSAAAYAGNPSQAG